jgi:hypothetical protein
MQPPQQNWQLYEKECRREHVAWLRSLTPQDSLALCESLHQLAGELIDGTCRAEREQARWEEKLAMRRRVVATLLALDRRHRE